MNEIRVIGSDGGDHDDDDWLTVDSLLLAKEVGPIGPTVLRDTIIIARTDRCMYASSGIQLVTGLLTYLPRGRSG